MSGIVVIGGGICGTAAALMLSRDGHEVTLVDRDPGPVPAGVDEAWERWERRSVAQMRLAHLMQPAGTRVLEAELPDVVDRLDAHGALRFNVVEYLLGVFGLDEARPDDARFTMVTGRRTTVEWVLASLADEQAGLTVRRGATVDALLAGPEVASGVPHVAGVRLTGGEELAADLVVDASGRRSQTPALLAELGVGSVPEEAEDSGFAYYGRFFRSADGSVPPMMAPMLTAAGSMSLLTIPSDNGTWSLTLYAASGDKPLRRFRDPAVYERVVRSFPLHAHWLDGEPISDMASMTGIVDRSRRYVVDGVPLATGIVSIADAWACTNPSLGRGMSIGLVHTALARRVIGDHLGDPEALALAFDAGTRAEVEPWHEATRELDRARVAEMRALAAGDEPPSSPVLDLSVALSAAASRDATCTRALGEVVGCLALGSEVFARPGLLDTVLAATAEPATAIPGPDRAELLALVS